MSDSADSANSVAMKGPLRELGSEPVTGGRAYDPPTTPTRQRSAVSGHLRAPPNSQQEHQAATHLPKSSKARKAN
jgi:hypothetical protein